MPPHPPPPTRVTAPCLSQRASLLLSPVWLCLNEQSDRYDAAFTRPVKHDVAFTPPLSSPPLQPLALYGADKQGHMLGV